MIGILSHKLNNDFLESLDLPFTLIDKFNPKKKLDIDGLYIDWIPKMSVNEVAWMEQASLLQTYIKSGIPIVIFDREFSLDKREVDWCSKFNVNLFEPALNSGRSGFKYLPEWILENNRIINENNRIYDVVYCHYNLEHQLKEFEKWFSDYSRIFHDDKVVYSTTQLSDFKEEEYKKNNLTFIESVFPIYDQGNVTIAIDTKKAYKIGYFDPKYFFAMNLGCLPLLPVEHKYFHSMFKGLVVNDLKEMNYHVNAFSKFREICIEEIFDRIKNQWNEFTLKHAIDVIRNCYE